MLAIRLILILLLLAYLVFLIIKIFSPQAGQLVLSETGTHSIRESNWSFAANVTATYLRVKQCPLTAIISAGKSVPGFL